MKTLITFLLTVTIMLPSYAQERTVDVGDFDELSLSIPANLYLKQGSSNSVTIECDDDIFDDIDFDLSGDRLVIERDGGWSWGSGWRKSEVTIYVTMKNLERLSISGSGQIESDGTLRADELKLSVSGSGDMELDLDAEELSLRISGSGSIRLDGNADEAEARISGSGKVKAEEMDVNLFEATISGSGSCYITANEEIKARISGSGSVYYKGDPKRVIGDSSGSGKIKKM